MSTGLPAAPCRGPPAPSHCRQERAAAALPPACCRVASPPTGGARGHAWRAGSELVAEMGGLHEFITWPRGMLTDSGGFQARGRAACRPAQPCLASPPTAPIPQHLHFSSLASLPVQMVSLLHLADITEEGVTFQSPTDGSRMLLTPEHSIQARGASWLHRLEAERGGPAAAAACVASHARSLAPGPECGPLRAAPPSLQVQNRLGADIIMALDDVVPSTAADDARFEEATHRTTRWIDRCIAAHGRPAEQNLFAIAQVRCEWGLQAWWPWAGAGVFRCCAQPSSSAARPPPESRGPRLRPPPPTCRAAWTSGCGRSA